MKQSVEIEFDATVKAVARNGELTGLSLCVTLPYGKRRSVSLVEEVSGPDRERVAAALKVALEAGLKAAVTKAQAAAAEALSVAVRKGEEV